MTELQSKPRKTPRDLPILKLPVPGSMKEYMDFSKGVLKMPIKFDFPRLKQTTEGVLKEFEVSARGTYHGVALQDPPEDVGQRVNQSFYGLWDRATRTDTGFRNGHFTKINEAGRRFEFIYDHFKSMGVTLLRGRIAMAMPGAALQWHVDNDFRIHIPIATNPQCRAAFERERFHMEADGSCYMHNGYLNHAFENLSKERRIHLIFVVGGLSFDTHDGSSPIADVLLKRPPGNTD